MPKLLGIAKSSASELLARLEARGILRLEREDATGRYLRFSPDAEIALGLG